MESVTKRCIGIAFLSLAIVFTFYFASLTGVDGKGVFEGWLGGNGYVGLEELSELLALSWGVILNDINILKFLLRFLLVFMGMAILAQSSFKRLLGSSWRNIYYYSGIFISIVGFYLPLILKYSGFTADGNVCLVGYIQQCEYMNPLFLFGSIYLFMGMQDRWNVWKESFLVAYTLIWVLLPVVRITVPDFYFEGTVWRSLFGLWLLFVAGLIVEYLIVPYFWPKQSDPNVNYGPTIDDIAPYKGKTVRQITEAGIVGVPRKFLFGMTDEELVKKWGMIGEAIIQLSQRRQKRIMAYVLCMVVWPLALFYISGGVDGAFKRDVVTMWETRPLPDGSVVATREAMTAANRVLHDEKQLLGLTGKELEEKLQLGLMNPAYKLNMPLYSWQSDQFVLRIGDGKDSYALIVTNDRQTGRAAVIRVHNEAYPVAPVRVQKRSGF